MTDHQNTHQLPDWEAPAPKKSIFSKFTTQSPLAYAKKEAPGENATTAKRTFTDRFLPRWAKRSRKTLIITIVALVLLLALILGLGLGLGLSHKLVLTLDGFHPAVLP